MRPSHAICIGCGICAAVSAQSMSAEWMWAGLALGGIALWAMGLDA